ncbi:MULTISPECIES: non-ribosomal peptide synthetase [unclassified Streptomyces]|uniref:non-ribosomal peptide synthetase n=1 Tax=unclassified Streptomyces TaxID=2593676 RepID=UPI003431FC44
MNRHQRAAVCTVAAPEPAPVELRTAAAARPAPATDEQAAAPPECIGPITVPATTMNSLRALAKDAGGDEFTALAQGAAVLTALLSRPGAPLRGRVMQGTRERSTGPVDPATDFRSLLESAHEEPAEGPVHVTLLVSENTGRLYVESTAASADAPTVQCWARTYLRLLALLAERPDEPVGSHPLVDDEERERILTGLNPYRDPELRFRSMIEPFEQQVARTPDAVALVDESGTTLTYRELNERANRLAHFLRAGGAAPGARIGVCLERGIPLVVAIYAAVKAGATYVPLDAQLPDARLALMIEESAPTHVLTDPACRDRIPAGDWRVVDVESQDALWAGYDTTDPVSGTVPADLFNILYTSGSTGRPKGVAYPADGALAHIDWMQRQYPFGPGDSALFKTSPGFDVSIWEIFWPLWHGARLVVCRPDSHGDARHLARLVEEHRITTLFLVPTVMSPFLEHVDPARATALRWALCGGEPVTPRVRDRFYATLPATTLVNVCGPTEAGTVVDMPIKANPGARVPLGRPESHFRMLVLDTRLRPVPVGMPGEAYVAGRTGLAQGYWRSPGRTAERFVPDPYGPPGSRMYRTGDLCRYDDDGVLEHLGRIDRQVKIHGLRIELGEIEVVLAEHPAVEDCAVVPHGEPARLLAFVVPAEGRDPELLDTAAILARTAARLPQHMRPERIVPVPAIPATVNGKLDADALLGHVPDRPIEPPADEVEAALAGLYSRLLGTAPVSVLDNFTQLGGHSMLAFQLLDACERELPAKPDVTALLTGTLREAAESIRRAAAAG